MQKVEPISSDYSQLLTICIPTYNRSLVICEALADLIPKIKAFGITIIVVDNCSTDFTRNVVEGFKSAYSNLEYYCQSSNKGYDINFETALKLSKTPYTWVLGDGNRLVENNIEALLISLDKNRPDAYIVDSYSRVKNIPNQVYHSVDKFLHDLGWHLTLLSATIYSKQIVEKAEYEKYRNTHFLHFGILFEYLGNQKQFTISWENLNIVHASSLPKLNGWNPFRVMEIFGKAWTDVVLSLPDSMSIESKKHCIQFHNKATKLFTFKHLKKQRAVGGLNYSIYKKYKNNIHLFAPGKSLLILFCALYPNVFNKYYRRYIRKGSF